MWRASIYTAVRFRGSEPGMEMTDERCKFTSYHMVR